MFQTFVIVLYVGWINKLKPENVATYPAWLRFFAYTCPFSNPQLKRGGGL